MSQTAKTAPPCRRCGSPVQTIGHRGLCLSCLSATTVARFPGADDAASGDLRLEEGIRLGPHKRFLLYDKLGSGGMGEVWLASDLELSRGEPFWVALKFLSKSIQRNKSALDAVRSEVIRSQELTHPNIVRVFDLHSTDDGMPFIKMEYVKGNSLSYWLQDCPNGVMQWKDVVEIALQLCHALQYAHENAGVIHRDIKPGNLLLRTDRILKLTDFGIAEALYTSNAAALEKHGLGTLWYASPQQIAGQRAVPADDSHAVGATLYELLTGTTPFLGDSPDSQGSSSTQALIYQVRHDAAESIYSRLQSRGIPNEIPRRLAELIHRCLEKEGHARPLAREILAELQKIHAEPQALGARQRSRPAPQLQTQPQPLPVVVEPLPEEVFAEPAPPAQRAFSPFAATLMVLLAIVAGVAVWMNPGFRTALAKIGKPAGAQPIPAADTNAVDQPPAEPAPPVRVETAPASAVADPETPIYRGGLIFAISAPKTENHLELKLARLGGQELARAPIKVEQPVVRVLDLPEGRYNVTLSEGNWYMSQPAEVWRGTNRVIRLEVENINFRIRTDPPTARLSIPREVGAAEIKEGLAYGFLRKGIFPVTAVLPGYTQTANSMVVTNDGVASEVVIKLRKNVYPSPGRNSWINSIHMSFVEKGPLWVCATETTVAHFQAFAAANPTFASLEGMISVTKDGTNVIAGRSWRNPGPAFRQLADLPVVGVNWHDAQAFCKWLTEKEQKEGFLTPSQQYRLPTRNEWISLAGGKKYPWGDDIEDLRRGTRIGNYAGLELAEKDADWPPSWLHLTSQRDGFIRTAPPVPAFLRAGLYHMGGNAAEWTNDKFLCGGSWADGEEGLHIKHYECLETQFQREIPPHERHDRNGFRVIVETLRSPAAL